MIKNEKKGIREIMGAIVLLKQIYDLETVGRRITEWEDNLRKFTPNLMEIGNENRFKKIIILRD